MTGTKNKNDIGTLIEECINNDYEVKIKSNNILRNNVINLIMKTNQESLLRHETTQL